MDGQPVAILLLYLCIITSADGVNIGSSPNYCGKIRQKQMKESAVARTHFTKS